MGDQVFEATLRTRSAEELIVMEVITVARMKNMKNMANLLDFRSSPIGVW